MRRTKEELEEAIKKIHAAANRALRVQQISLTEAFDLADEVSRLRSDLEDAEREIAELRKPPKRGACGIDYHDAWCDGGGAGGSR
jgi:hypothetical protein